MVPYRGHLGDVGTGAARLGKGGGSGLLTSCELAYDFPRQLQGWKEARRQNAAKNRKCVTHPRTLFVLFDPLRPYNLLSGGEMDCPYPARRLFPTSTARILLSKR